MGGRSPVGENADGGSEIAGVTASAAAPGAAPCGPAATAVTVAAGGSAIGGWAGLEVAATGGAAGCGELALGVTPGEQVEAPKWKPITLVTIGIVCFALLLERAGLFPALVVLILISSLAGEEFKLLEVIGNIVVLSILCVIVFKLGLGMNISILQGVW